MRLAVVLKAAWDTFFYQCCQRLFLHHRRLFRTLCFLLAFSLRAMPRAMPLPCRPSLTLLLPCVFQWQDPRQPPALWYVVYRWLSAALFFAVAVCSVLDAGRDGQDLGVRYVKWPIYLTNWGLACCCLQAALGAGLATSSIVQDRRQRRGTAGASRLPGNAPHQAAVGTVKSMFSGRPSHIIRITLIKLKY